MGAWASPALVAWLATRVVAGDQSAPLLGLLAVVAALGALLAASRGDPGPLALTGVTGSTAVSIALAAGILAVAEAGVAFGVSPDHALALGMSVACAGALLRHVPILPGAALVLSSLAFTAVVTSMAVHTGAPPWVAWARLASEPARVFPATAAWVTEGRAVPRTTTVAFTENHRLTALTAGVFRVTGTGPTGAAVREWRLAEGDSLTVHPGDRLTLSPGTRVRFEAGKRIPGVAATGVAWADPRARGPGALWEALGLVVALAGGALVLVGSARGGPWPGAVVAPLSLVVLVLGSASWGVYAAWLTPDLAIGASPLTSLAAAPLAVAPPEWAIEVTATVAVAITSLLFATAANLVRRLDELVAPWASRRSVRSVPLLLGLGAVVGAAAVAWRDVEAEAVLRLALGLGAAAWAAPRLAGDRPAAMVAGAVVGGVVFIGLALVMPVALPGARDAVPVLVAVPLAALAALASRRAARPAAARRPRQVPVPGSQEGSLPR